MATWALMMTFCVLDLFGGILCYQTGAPFAACYTMTPEHGVQGQTTPPPFSVTPSTTEYTNGSKIEVTLDSLCYDRIGGFILEARRADTNQDRVELIGTFNNIDGSRAVADCGNGTQAVTHTNGLELKQQMVFEWTAPAAETGHIVFVATFAPLWTEFWTHVYSDIVKAQGDGSTVNPGEDTYPTVSLGCTTTVTPPSTEPAGGTGSVPYDDECGKSKGCFVKCKEGECDFLVSWKPGSTNVEFELAAVVEGNTNKWLALGFSNDAVMSDDSVIECALRNNDIKVYSSYNIWQANDRLVGDPSEGVTKEEGSISNGVLRCTIKRVIETGNAQIFNLNTEYHLMFAMGDTEDTSDQKQGHSLEVGKRPVTTTRKVNVLSTQEVHGEGAKTAGTTNVAYGTVMLTVCLFVAILPR